MLHGCLGHQAGEFCLERSFPDYFLLAWCKKAPPDGDFVSRYGRFVSNTRLVPTGREGGVEWGEVEGLMRLADSVGGLLSDSFFIGRSTLEICIKDANEE